MTGGTGLMSPERTERYADFEDWQLFDRIGDAGLGGFSRELLRELMCRYEPHADLERPPTALAWCLDCDWEKEVEPTWIYPDPMERARKAAAGHIGNTDCDGYDFGRAPG